jgi:hypothetical protein
MEEDSDKSRSAPRLKEMAALAMSFGVLFALFWLSRG